MECYYNNKLTVIFKMDNLELLKEMPDKCIQLIYCDVLYNSGKDFGDYNDNLGSPEEAVKWYEPRLREMKRILKADGSIYIHCNWRLDSYLRILMDKIFGPECFKNRIVPLFEQGILNGRNDVRHMGDIAIDFNVQQKHWLISPLQFEKMVANNEVRLIDGLPYSLFKC